MNDGPKKAAKWNPGLSTKHQANRPVENPKTRWEDEINDFFNGKPNTQLQQQAFTDRCRTSYATNARNLTFALGENEFSETAEESGEVRFLQALFYNRRSRRSVGVSLVSLTEQQVRGFGLLNTEHCKGLMSSKPLGHKSLPHFSPKPPSCSEQNPRIPQCC